MGIHQSDPSKVYSRKINEIRHANLRLDSLMRQYPSVILPVHTDTYRTTQIFMVTDLAPINPNYIVELSITKAITG